MRVPLRPYESSYLVVIVKVNPSTESLNGLSPLCRVAHDNGAAFFVVFANAEFLHSGLAGNTKLLVNFMLNRKPMGVPTESALNMVTLHRPVSGDNVLNDRGQQMAVVRQAGGEGRAVEKGVSRKVGSQFELKSLLLDMIESDCRDKYTWRWKALITLHFSRTASSSLGKLIDILIWVELPTRRAQMKTEIAPKSTQIK